MAVCVHAHCYQPPREDPATGEVPEEPTAAPYHDWNERITDECYRPLAAARIEGHGGAPDRTINLYASLDFNLAPTLGSWLDRFAPDVSAAMLDGDRASCARHDGHGGAIAHPWVHAILPLASPRDRETLVRWGIAEFVHRFGRAPEGMWLPETAVDAVTLDCLAANGIRFTIVAPHQVATTDGSHLRPDEPYEVRLASGRSIVLFAYDGALAHGVAFGGLLADGERLAREIASGAQESGGQEVLRSFATDAETFGHHHMFGELGLAWALHRVEEEGHEVVPYGAWLARVGPGARAAVVDGTSWSCAHGLERWRSDCGCRVGTGPDQSWRTPLRDAIDRTVARVASLTDQRASSVFVDPWAARDAWVDVLTGRLPREEWASAVLVDGAKVDVAVEWMEAHRHLLMAQSSCAWFFDDADGHEAMIGIRWARSAIATIAALTGVDLAPEWDEETAPMFSRPRPSGPA